jgi:hypothetical protein
MYMNFTNTLPTGAKVYSRIIPVCPNRPVRISTYLTTSFSGVQCDVRIEITDGNNVSLENITSNVAAYYPTWTHYQSADLTPTTSTIKFNMYTNVAGSQGGNDLSVDDILVEQCTPLNLGNDTTICNTAALFLDAGSGYNSYLWNDNSTGQTLTASTTAGSITVKTYYVTVNDSSSCTFRDTINVTFNVCSGINDGIESDYFSIFPNPGKTYISISSKEEISLVEIYNLAGMKVKEQVSGKDIFVGDLPSGNYFIKAETVNGERFQKSVVVE